MNQIHEKKWIPQKVAVLGAGKSGIATLSYLLDRLHTVLISDSCTEEKLVAILSRHGLFGRVGLEYEANGHTQKILSYELIIISPGIALTHPLIQAAYAAHIPIWSEMELGYRQSDARFIAITGSSGKSTTTSLVGSILSKAGTESVVAGNIGIPVISVGPRISRHGYVVAEISSFQIDTLDQFHPQVAAITNLMMNHLDRYESVRQYYESKKSIIRSMTPDDTIVLYGQDEELAQWSLTLAGKVQVCFFGSIPCGDTCCWFQDGWLWCQRNKQKLKLVHLDDMILKGSHNYLNAASAAMIALCIGVPHDAIAQGICSFEGLPHRLEFIRTLHGVSYYNDSKSTTAESIHYAVSAFGHVVHLIAGGRDKLCDFSSIKGSITKHVKSVTLIGEAAQRMYDEWHECTATEIVPSLRDAVNACCQKAQPGDVVVLSPGCSSYDMFTNFEERGEVFKTLVHSLQ